MLKKLVLSVGLVSALAGAQAQDFDRTVASIILLQDPKVQKDLKVTEAQRAKMNTHAGTFQKAAKAYNDKLQKQGKNAKPDPAMETKLLGSLKGNVLAVLTAAQITRLRQISLQVLGVGALGDDLVAAKVGISASQKTTIRGHLTDGLKRATAIQQGVATEARKGIKEPKTEAEMKKANETVNARLAKLGPPAQQKLQVIRVEVERKVLAVLTPAQKATWTKLLGPALKP